MILVWFPIWIKFDSNDLSNQLGVHLHSIQFYFIYAMDQIWLKCQINQASTYIKFNFISFNVMDQILLKCQITTAHQASTYIPLLAKRGVLVQLGFVLEPHQVSHTRWTRCTRWARWTRWSRWATPGEPGEPHQVNQVNQVSWSEGNPFHSKSTGWK